MNKYYFMSGDALREVLKEVPDEAKLPMLVYDFADKSGTSKREMISKRNVCELGEQAPSIVFSGNEYLSQINFYTHPQKDLFHIEPRGIMKSVLLGGV